jgi:hypothetical protein
MDKEKRRIRGRTCRGKTEQETVRKSIKKCMKRRKR